MDTATLQIDRKLKEELSAWVDQDPDRESGRDLVELLVGFVQPTLDALAGPGLRRAMEPEDLLQEALLAILCSANRLAHSDARRIRAWIGAIVRARIIDLARRTRALKRGDALSQSLSVIALEETHLGSEGDPSVLSERREGLRLAAAWVAALPADQRQAIELHELEGRSTREIASRMQRSPEAVRKLIARGRRTLAGWMEGR